YLLILLAGTVIPFGNSTVLSDNYTMHIRWDYLLHALIYIPVPVLFFLSLRQGPGKAGPQQAGRQEARKQEFSNEQFGRQQAGNRQSGRQQAGNRQSGRQQAGNRWTGNGRILVTVMVVSLLITVLFEGLQLIIPYRSFNINDMTANGVGAMIGLLLVLVFRKSLEDLRITVFRRRS
ncbi:MAG: VanZ family protein, partial [Bacteroidota bacterium]